MFFHNFASPDVSVSSCLPVWVIGATEQHGAHLPLGTDTFIAEGIVDRALAGFEKKDCVLKLPTLSVGCSLEHTNFPGTLSLSSSTLASVVRDVAQSLGRHGHKKLVFLNGHGGNGATLDAVALELRAHFGMHVLHIALQKLGEPDALSESQEFKQERAFGIHGGAVETSLMLALHPELVKMDLAFSYEPLLPVAADALPRIAAVRPASLAWMAEDLNPSGVVGNPRLASAEMGHAILAYRSKVLTGLLREFISYPLNANM